MPLKRKHFPQNSQVNGIAPVWILWCSLKVPFSLKVLPHTAHWCGLAPVCTVSCFFNCKGVLNLQFYFIFVRISECAINVYARDVLTYAFVHWEQLYGLSTEWVKKWASKFPFCMKLLPHWSHVKFLTPEWIRLCVTRFGFVENLKMSFIIKEFLCHNFFIIP